MGRSPIVHDRQPHDVEVVAHAHPRTVDAVGEVRDIDDELVVARCRGIEPMYGDDLAAASPRRAPAWMLANGGIESKERRLD